MYIKQFVWESTHSSHAQNMSNAKNILVQRVQQFNRIQQRVQQNSTILEKNNNETNITFTDVIAKSSWELYKTFQIFY